MSSVALGAVEGVDAGASGSYCFDLFESRLQTNIGTVSGAQPCEDKEGLLSGDLTLNSMPKSPGLLAGGSGIMLVFAGEVITTTITYTYDPLYRLTAADYSDETYYHYIYDAVGNRLSETTQTGSTSFTYDNANRLTSVDGITYTWDNNGNLLSDGVNSYSYNRANRLIAISNQQSTISNRYNGLGDRVQQTVDSVTTNYSLDLAAGLTQVLSDGSNTYLYGLGRIGEQQPDGRLYHLGDALGSVRQLVDATGEVSLAQDYEPYGDTRSSLGEGASAFQFTGEMRDASGLTYLRARYLNSWVGRFITRDTWEGDINAPMSLNLWNYAQSNPVNYRDPTGNFRIICPSGWSNRAVRWRVDEAEKYVYHTSDPMDTYTAAGIAIQCAGWDNPFNPNSGVGIAQVSKNQAETEWGKPVFDKNGNIRGYGLRWGCPNGELEEALDPNNNKDAVILMKRRIQLVTNECTNCTATDIYIAAGLAQNGPGFTHINMRKMPKLTPDQRESFGIVMDWIGYFRDDARDGDMVNTKIQLNRFILVVNELRRRRWNVPFVHSTTIERLKNWQVTQ